MTLVRGVLSGIQRGGALRPCIHLRVVVNIWLILRGVYGDPFTSPTPVPGFDPGGVDAGYGFMLSASNSDRDGRPRTACQSGDVG